MVKQWANRYVSLWILITEQGHEARKSFTDLYEEDKLRNIDHKL